MSASVLGVLGVAIFDEMYGDLGEAGIFANEEYAAQRGEGGRDSAFDALFVLPLEQRTLLTASPHLGSPTPERSGESAPAERDTGSRLGEEPSLPGRQPFAAVRTDLSERFNDGGLVAALVGLTLGGARQGTHANATVTLSDEVPPAKVSLARASAADSQAVAPPAPALRAPSEPGPGKTGLGGGRIRPIATDCGCGCGNSPPVAYDGSACTTHDMPLYDSVQFDDPDWEDTPWAVRETDVSHGTLYLEPDGSYTYEPDYHYVGPDSFTFYATDGKDDSNTATVTIDVTNQKPVAYDASACTPHDVTLAGEVQFYDYDWIDTPWAVLATQASYGTAVLQPGGSYTYEPDYHYVGPDSFTFYATDGLGDGDPATVTIDVTNQKPVAYDASACTRHDVALADEVEFYDYDWIDTPWAVLATDASHGTVDLQPDGSYTYEPDYHYVGPDSFTFYATDGLGDGDPATVTIDVTNQAPVAEDDDLYVYFEDPATSVQLDVLWNDYDPDADDLTITYVSETAEGASVAVDTSGEFIWYTLPPESPTELQMGGVIVLIEEIPESTEGVETWPHHGGFDPFEDSFEYQIADVVGATSQAFCQVRMQNQPEWEMKLKPAYNEAAEIGVDGTPGYYLEILQEFGRKAPGMRALPKTQTWQKNTLSAKTVFVNTEGAVKLEAVTDLVLADTSDIRQGSRTPLRITDKLGSAPSSTAAETLLITETVAKKLGINAANKTLPTPSKQPWKPNEQQRAVLDTMRGPFLETTTTYVFVDKQRALELHVAGTLSTPQLNAIKQVVQQQGLDWDELPAKYEKYSIGDLGSWEYTP